MTVGSVKDIEAMSSGEKSMLRRQIFKRCEIS